MTPENPIEWAFSGVLRSWERFITYRKLWIDKKEMESAIDYGGGEIIINSV